MSSVLTGHFSDKIFLEKKKKNQLTFLSRNLEKFHLKSEYYPKTFSQPASYPPLWILGLMTCFHAACIHRGSVFLVCTFLLENSSSLIWEPPILHLQPGWTFVLIISCLIMLLHAAAGLLHVPFMSDNIPIVLPRS